MLNPITFTDQVVRDFLRYQLTAYPLADARLNRQMRTLLNLEQTRNTPLLRGPYISLSRAFRQGPSIAELVAEGILHAHMRALVPYERLYGHQATAIRAIARGRTTLVATGTGSGKTESFLYPIISRCLHLRDENAAPGIAAVIVYPMNALAEDQLERMRGLLAGSGVSFGLYVGKTPEHSADVAGVRLQQGASRADYEAEQRKLDQAREARAVHPYEERASREELRGNPPRILLTNVKQLELLLTRQKDIEMFGNSRLEFLVFDETHTFRGANGAETACLIRRLRSFCGKSAAETVCIGASATIAGSAESDGEGVRFATRFFGVAAEQVEIVREEYEPDAWATVRRLSDPFPGDPNVRFEKVLLALRRLEDEPESAEARERFRDVFETLSGHRVDVHRLEESLYEHLSSSELLFQASELLPTAESLEDFCKALGARVGRGVPVEESLTWLALGAFARRNGRTLVRPVIHGFIRGVGGAVVTFPGPGNEPQLWLTAEDQTQSDQAEFFRLNVTTCTTCGQQYFVHWLRDFSFLDRQPTNGEAVEDRYMWRPQSEANGGSRVVLLDRLVVREGEEGEEEVDAAGAPRNTHAVYLCRKCGTVHPRRIDHCDGCGRSALNGTPILVQLFVVQQKRDTVGRLHSCVACRASGRWLAGGHREPARPVRAVNVSDVFVLAQSMIQHADHKRLLVFADNRQEAAFQAGWMQDHARRYRLRALMYSRIRHSAVSVGDLTAWLDAELARNEEESRALAPEVWRVARKEAAGNRHAQERFRFLRIQVLRELTMGQSQRIGLEPWGRMVVQYIGLDESLPFFARWSERMGCTGTELRDGVAGLLDVTRRGRILLDREGRVFSRYWRADEREVSYGYLPFSEQPPMGLKLQLGAADHASYVKQWMSARGHTAARHAARRWGVPAEQAAPFFEELWDLLANQLHILAAANLTGSSNRALPGTAGAMQIDADRLLMIPHEGVWRCDVCRRRHARAGPQRACLVNRCPGTLVFEREEADNYDLQLLTDGVEMVKPREHSAQIPSDDRERLEREFKSGRDLVNTLIATPTLELGVDIGPLDSVLMRNVPPLPANYWQRAGRAGRRQRMAVNLTYCRTASHDRAYFAEPLKLLAGRIEPPGFNLRNEVMVRKHLHATVITVLHTLAQSGSAQQRAAVLDVLNGCFPTQIGDYLFDAAGEIRRVPFEVAPLGGLIAQHREQLLTRVESSFTQGWPQEDSTAVRPMLLAKFLDEMSGELALVIDRLRRRLRWATDQMERLEDERRRKGTLDREDEALYERCDRLVKRLKGVETKRRRDSEGVDDTYTFGVLAAEGFLPGYGLDSGFVTGYYQAPLHSTELRDWQLHRSPSLALREYVPGNLIYANGHRFLARYFHLEPEAPIHFQIDTVNEAVCEAQDGGGAIAAQLLPAVPVCDVDLPHNSHISDDEDYRFQMPVAIYGYEQKFHGGGRSFRWGPKTVQFRHAVRLRLVNAGPAQMVKSQGTLGYPVCTVCGQSRSPLASTADLNEFLASHRERCRRPVDHIGFFADVHVDALSIAGCKDRQEAHSVSEALRVGAAQILDMELEDLQPLAIGRQGQAITDVLLYDPMPGGSGLIDQIVLRWDEVVAAARAAMEACASACVDSCIDCLQTFRNSYYHRHLNRHVALDLFRDWGSALVFSNEIPARLPVQGPEQIGMNNAEETLREMLNRAGLHGYEAQRRLELGPPLGATIPDFFYADPDGIDPGICIYLDGLSHRLHGSPETAARDRRMREQLRSMRYQVIEIPFGHLTDRAQMGRHFFSIGRLLLDKAQARSIRDNSAWFDAPAHEPEAAADPWEEILSLLDAKWHPLANGLRTSGLPAPKDVDWDILMDGRVSGQKAVMIWDAPEGTVLLIEENTPLPNGTRHVAATTDADPSRVAADIRDGLDFIP